MSASALAAELSTTTHHFQKLVTFVEVSHEYALAFRYRAVDADKLAVLAHRVNLV